jgi:hypothetical protein
MDNYGNLTFLDIITIMSFAIGIENMGLNKHQIRNKESDSAILSTILEQQEEILKLLKEKKND